MTESEHKGETKSRRRRLMLWLLLGLSLTIGTGVVVLRYRYLVWLEHVAAIESADGAIQLTSSKPDWLALDRLQPDGTFWDPVEDPIGPNWFRKLLPVDGIRMCFYSVEGVEFGQYGQRVLSNISGVRDLNGDVASELEARVLENLRGFPHLERLNLKDEDVDDACLAGLQDVTSLRWLTLEKTPISGEGLRHLSKLVNLEELLLSKTQVTDGGLKHLESLSRLRRLDLQGTKITDAGLESIRQLTQLEVLDLSDTQIQGPQLQELTPLQELKWLDLRGINVDDEGLAALASLAELRFLFVSSGNLTTEGVKPLSRLKNLKVLRVGYLSEEEIDELQGLFPTVEFALTAGSLSLDFGRYEDLLGSLDDPGFRGGGGIVYEIGEQSDEERAEAFETLFEALRDGNGQLSGGGGFF